MTIVYVPREIGNQIPNIEAHVREKLIENIVYYIIDRKYRTTVNVQQWLNSQIKQYQSDEDLLKVAKTLVGKTHDDTAMKCLKYVHDHTVYTTDDKKWNMPEKWEDAKNVWETQRGDCESGALLIYVLARLAGIPASKLWLITGDVKGGGHCWLGYIPDEYPLNLVFLDWCYWYKSYSIPIRNKFTIMNKAIHEYKSSGEKVDSSYYNLWFVFNEEKSYRSFR